MHISAYVAGVVGKQVAKELVDRTASRTASIVNCFADVLGLAETRCYEQCHIAGVPKVNGDSTGGRDSYNNH